VAIRDQNKPHHASWEAFVRRHPGHRFLDLDPLYALPEAVIDAIAGVSKDFFSEEELTLELDLTETANFGFFHHQVLLGPVWKWAARKPELLPVVDTEFPGRSERLNRELNELYVEELEGAGLSKLQSKRVKRMLAEEEKAIQNRSAAYAGWLVTNREFRTEAAALRTRWEAVVRERGRFPEYPRWPFAEPREDEERFKELNEACRAFYLRWGLSRLVTWELPEPIHPDLIGQTFEDTGELSEAGALLFIPWYSMRSEQFNLQTVLHRMRLDSAPAHLRDWLLKQEQVRGRELGDLSYQRLLWLYQVYKLALETRYGRKCRRHVEKIDLALSNVIGIDAQAVRKLRQRLNRELRAR
jgi:hypothetical protein